jgi:cytochrome c oxidase assembly protein subunit 15
LVPVGFQSILLKINQLNWTARFAVTLVFCLIFVGGLVTSWQAGMAVPDWPLSFGSLNPEGWWANFPVRLEHGHRLLAAGVGVVVGVLCAAVWCNFRALGMAFAVSIGASVVGTLLGAPVWLRAHLGVWPAAISFLLLLFWTGHSRSVTGKVERSLAVAAFVLVCLQATLGGLRVTRETAGAVDVATVLRIVHGCVAQAFLVTLVALSVRLSLLKNLENRSVLAVSNAPSGWVWFALLAVYGQLVLGATMRHLGAGLAIPTFPAANPEGGWMPKTHNLYTDLNFTHTRVGAILVVLIVIFAVWKTWAASPPNSSPRMAAMRTGVLVVLQAVLGVLVVLHHKPKTLATVHVVLGASLLASLAALLVHLISDPSRAESGGIA